MSFSVLMASHLAKAYKRRPIVQNVSLSIHQNEIVGLLGRNGAGKTTSFYMLVGLIQPDSGKVWLDQQDMTSLSIDQRAHQGLSYLPQEPSIFRKLTVAQNILAILEICTKKNGLDAAGRQQKAQQLMQELHIEHLKDSLGFVLSGGERRRVEIARTLATQPRFILLDEPFAGIDPISVIDIKRIILQLNERGIGILITDHNVRETLDICHRAYIVNDGCIMAEGSPAQILSDKKVREVYLGEAFEGYTQSD